MLLGQIGEWGRRAACKDVFRPREYDPWFPEEQGRASERLKKVGLNICRTQCPVRQECLEYALATDQRYGVWGGMDRTQRLALARERGKIA